MKKEYGFSKKRVRGKFYNPDAVFQFPVYLEPDVDAFMSELAEDKGIDVQQLRMRSQIKFDKETHPQRLDRYPKSKVKNGQALINEWLRANIQSVKSAY